MGRMMKVSGPPGAPTHIGTCDAAGKRMFVDRRSAKRYANDRRKAGWGNMRPYSCDACESWHVGHLPRAVRAGHVTCAEVYG